MPSVPIRPARTSELQHSELISYGDVTYWRRSTPPQLDVAEDDIIYTIRADDILDNLANAFYGDPRLKWVIQHLNQLWLEPLGLIPGETLRIPTMARLRQNGILKN